MGPTERDAHPFVTVLVPAYNEAGHLYQNLETLRDHLTTAAFDWELVVVDDGSNDDTGIEAHQFADHNENVVVVSHVVNMGLGQALKTGFRASSGEYIVAFDADLSYSPDHIDLLVATIDSTGAGVVVASPYMTGGSVEGVPRLRAVLSRFANRLLKALTIGHVATVTGMVRAYRRDFVAGLSLKSVDNQINAEIIYKATLLRENIVEVPAHLVWTRNEEDTRTRRGSFSIIKTTLDFLFSGFIFRPFIFYILPGGVLLLLALYSLAWAGYHIVVSYGDQVGSFDARVSAATAESFSQSPHTFVVGGIALLFAFQLISVGILSAQNKRYFEELWFQGNWLSKPDDQRESTALRKQR